MNTKNRRFKELYLDFYDRSENAYLYDKRPKWLITFNGQGNSGKTTIAQMLEAEGIGLSFNIYNARDRFQRYTYNFLERTPEQQNIEVFGIPSVAWIATEFHRHVKPFLNAGQTVILDHYLGDYIVDMLEDLKDIEHFKKFVKYIQLPWLSKTISFYLDIDHDTYIDRHSQREHALKENDEIAESNFVVEKLFDARRKRYQKLVEAGYLKKIDATADTQTVLEKVKKVIQNELQKNS